MTAARTAEPVRWGFLGAGFVAAKALAPAVHAADGAVLQVVGARDPRRAAALAPRRHVDSYDHVCASDDVDAVYIALPNSDHRPWVHAALAAGKHVLCEKPLGLDAAEVQSMAAAAQGAGRLLVEASWNRWHPRMRRAEHLLADLPGPREARAWFTFDSVPPGNYRLDPTRGGGALLDVGCYGVAAALAALGTDVVQVRDVQRRVGPTGVDLTTRATLAHGDRRAQVTASFEQPESQGLEIDAPGLRIEFSGEAFTNWNQPSSLRLTRDATVGEERFAACDPYRLMVEAVSARVRGEDAWVLPLATSLAVAGALDDISLAGVT